MLVTPDQVNAFKLAVFSHYMHFQYDSVYNLIYNVRINEDISINNNIQIIFNP